MQVVELDDRVGVLLLDRDPEPGVHALASTPSANMSCPSSGAGGRRLPTLS